MPGSGREPNSSLPNEPVEKPPNRFPYTILLDMVES